MEISVEVIDGIHGKPAEGVSVSLVSLLGNIEVKRVERRTDQLGNVKYSTHGAGTVSGETYHIEIDTHIYFATLGIDCCQRKVAIFFHASELGDDYRITSLIAPSMHSTYFVRRELT
jgi:5-hydroxyisourate hydrolase-like protein (transthyretin family)